MPQTAHPTKADPLWPRARFWGQIWLPYRTPVALLLLVQVAQSLAALTLPALSAQVINLGVLRHDTSYITNRAAVMLGAGLVQVVCASLAVWLGARVAMGLGHDLRAAVFARVQGFSLHEMRRFGTPSLITRSTNDVAQVQGFPALMLSMMITAPIMGVGGIIMAVRQDLRLSALLVVSVPLLAALIGTLMAMALPLFSKMQGQIDRLTQIVTEQIAGLRVIRAFVRDGQEQARFATANDAMTNTALSVGRIMSVNMPLAHLIMQLSAIAMVWFAAPRIAAPHDSEATMDVGTLVAFMSYNMQILISVMIASMLIVMAPRALISAGRIREVLQTAASVVDPAQPKPLPPGPPEIEFCNVSFAYPGAQSPILNDISFKLGAGQTLAIIGATGSGKSTILNLIARLFDPTAGSIRLNGTDLRDLGLDALWSQIGLVPQESLLFSGTVASNLRYGRADAVDAALWHALDVAQARSFIADRPEGLAAPVVQGGGNFSGGQRQRLTIARALVRRPPIYLLDDCFSALDYTTDAALRLALATETKGAALLIVGQRVSALQSADTILLLDQGRIAAQGSHASLMAQSAAYRAIVASQQTDDLPVQEAS